MLDPPRPCPGDAGVAPFLARRERLAFLRLALDVHAPAVLLEPAFALPVHVALVAVEVAAGVGGVEHVLKMHRIVLRSRADLDLANQLVTLVGVDGELVAESGLAVLFRPGGVHVLLPALGGLPADGHGVVLDQFPSSGWGCVGPARESSWHQRSGRNGRGSRGGTVRPPPPQK